MPSTLFGLISVGYHLELCVVIIFTNIIVFYQLSSIIFFGVFIILTTLNLIRSATNSNCLAQY